MVRGLECVRMVFADSCCKIAITLIDRGRVQKTQPELGSTSTILGSNLGSN